MSQQPITYDYGEYWISDEGREEWYWIQWDLKGLRLFLTTVEDFIEEQESREIAEVEDQQAPPIDWSEHYPWYWQDIVGTQLRQSYIVALMSAAEQHLKNVCLTLGTILQEPLFSSNKIKMCKFLEEMRKSLRITVGFSIPSDDMWDFVDQLRAFRNVLVHHAGVLEGDEEALKVGKLKGSPGLELDSGLVKIGPEFCPFAHERIDRFFEELRQEYVGLCRRLV